jgi:glucose-6-phosphate 1-epimerase
VPQQHWLIYLEMTAPAEEIDMPKITLMAGNSQAVIYCHGAHVVSWTVRGVEQLFMSSKAVLKPPKAIRGGIPVCWPQFSDLGSLGQHGFARNAPWTPVVHPEGASAIFRLSSKSTDPALLGAWAYPFELELQVTLSDDTLVQEFTVRNTGDKTFAFTTALHTYFAVPDATEATVDGLTGTRYLDSLDGRAEKVDSDPAVAFLGEVDRIYLGVSRELAVRMGASERVVTLTTSDTLGDAVVWNPWIDKAKKMTDFGDDEYRGMLCVEVAQCRPAVVLAPGAHWVGSQKLRNSNSTF